MWYFLVRVSKAFNKKQYYLIIHNKMLKKKNISSPLYQNHKKMLAPLDQSKELLDPLLVQFVNNYQYQKDRFRPVAYSMTESSQAPTSFIQAFRLYINRTDSSRAIVGTLIRTYQKDPVRPTIYSTTGSSPAPIQGHPCRPVVY